MKAHLKTQPMETEVITLNEERNVTLTAFIQPAGEWYDFITKRPAVLILPGGGYQRHQDREAEPVAFPYLAAGYQAFILRYSVAEHATWPNPLDDCDQALKLIREKSDEWLVYPDKIAVIGFSAGGHLAAASATMGSERPNAAIIGYGAAGTGMMEGFPSPCEAVDEHTSPCFVFAARDDGACPIAGSIEFLGALAKYNISFESHIYSYGGHGWSTGNPGTQTVTMPHTARASDWVQDSIGWLGELFGTFDGKGGMTEPVVGQHSVDDYEPYLSTMCTLGKIASVPEAMAAVGTALASAGVDLSAAAGQASEMSDWAKAMRLYDILHFSHLVSDEFIAELDAELRTIANPTA